MLKVVALIWIILGTTLAGIGLVVVVTIPSLSAQSMVLIPVLALAGFLIGLPLSYFIAKNLQGAQRA